MRALPLVAALSFTAVARAEPQAHVALRPGVAGAGEAGAVWEDTRFFGGIVADVLFLRSRNADFGVGPYLELTTAGFFDSRWGGGLGLLAPVTEDFPLVLQVGGYGHELGAFAAGGSIFWGARSYNFHSFYNLSAGLFVSAYRDLDERGATLLAAGVELDALLFALPFLAAGEALR